MGAAEMARAVFTEELSSSPGILGKLSQSPAPGAQRTGPALLVSLATCIQLSHLVSFFLLFFGRQSFSVG